MHSANRSRKDPQGTNVHMSEKSRNDGNAKRIQTILCIAGTLLLTIGKSWALPVVVDSSVGHPLSQAQVGDLLIGQFRCTACHDNREQDPILEKSAPDLSEVGARIAPDYLRRYLASPSLTQPGTTMPDMLNTRSETERAEIAEALTHFLISQSKKQFRPEADLEQDANVGKELFHSVGCVACHAPREVIARELTEEEDVKENENEKEKEKNHDLVAVQLEHVPAKYSHQSLSEFLFQPLRVRSSGRMPDMRLTTKESEAIATYLLSEHRQVRESLSPRESLVQLGEKYFQELNCIACHALSNIPAVKARGSLRSADLGRGCLSNTGRNAPQFHLKETQIQAIVASLKRVKAVESVQVRIAQTLTVFNCVACHTRDDFGGVTADRNMYFQSSEKNLGDDGRIPPPLTLVGAKLQPVWLKKVLFDGESVRPFMTTRMPQFGETNLRHLPELLEQCDELERFDFKLPNPESSGRAEQEREKKLRAGGRELLGDQGLNCIACHNFNGKPSPINKGIDLMTTFQRLQPAWFNNFLRNPAAYRPRIVMPYSWPGGIAAHKTILDGDTELQIEAIWYYLSLGTSAADPPGIRRQETNLLVLDTARTYRGRSSVAGFRGIAVGFPEKLSYAFNAETGTLTAIWRGDFIRVDRGGQGSGGFNPSSKAIALAQDVSFVELADANTSWPLRPVMTKESPVNPNPLYPKNLGYQFKGYSFDESSVPTFVYRSGSVEFEDRSVAIKEADRLLLKRTLQFKSPINQTLWFRALTGDIEQESENVYKTRNLRLTIPRSEVHLRTLSDNPQTLELLFRLSIREGQSKLEFTYEPLE